VFRNPYNKAADKAAKRSAKNALNPPRSVDFVDEIFSEIYLRDGRHYEVRVNDVTANPDAAARFGAHTIVVGAIYNLSASPDTIVAENYIYGIPDRIALYLDEGSRYITIRNNLVDGAGTWLTVNTQNDYAPLRASIDNTARGNWYTQSKLTGRWVAHNNNRLGSNELVEPGAWLAAAKKVMENFTPARAQCHASRSPQTAHGAGR
jgi:hypothetical protein